MEQTTAKVMEDASGKLLDFMGNLCGGDHMASLTVMAVAAAGLVEASGDPLNGFRFVGVFTAIAAGDLDKEAE